MERPLNTHTLLTIDVAYTDILTGRRTTTSVPVTVVRPAMPLLEKMPIDLDQHINRYSAATTISESIGLAKQFDFSTAQQKLDSLVQRIQKSSSGREPYCQDLVKDLQECMDGMTDTVSFHTGIHSAHAFSSMYFMERSAGLKNRSRHRPAYVRHLSYGYATAVQEYEAQAASEQTRVFIGTYSGCKA